MAKTLIKEEEKIKKLKINHIYIEDFKNIDFADTSLADWNIIGGYNGQGKSSFTEAILTAIQGHKFYGTGATTPASLVKNGKDKATVITRIDGEDQEIVIERTFKKGTAKNPAGKTILEATLNGEKIAQKSLDSLMGSLTLDPLKLGTLSKTEQIKEIKATTGLDTSEIDKEIKDAEEDRKESGAYKDRMISVYDNAKASGVPDEVKEKSIDGLLKDRQLLQQKEDKTQEYKNQASYIKELEEKLKQEKEKLEKIKQEGTDIVKQIKDKKLGTLAEIDEEIAGIEEHNKKYNEYQDFLKYKKQKDDAVKEWEELDDKVKTLRSKRTEIIANSKLPDYMEISEEYGILVDGVEYLLLNTARKIEVAIDLVLLSESPLRLIRIEQGGELDVKTLDKIKDKIIENDFQILIERPVIDKFDSIIIEDGEIIEDKEKYITKENK